ncbi:MAG: AAA family ATPase [Candidatus Lokiarchaeota archaeon]|nr:AAA family ATPase [Candidatus Lokiarchaeota archaeon]
MTSKVFKIGNTEVPINTRASELIPEEDLFLVDKDNESDIEKILKGIEKNYPVLLTGPTGCGKTSMVKYLAHKTNNAYRRIQLNGSTGVDNFVGRWLINSKGTYWQDGILTEAWRKGEFLLLDELNAALPEILFVLHSIMDGDKALILDEKDGEVVKAHPDFRLFSAINPSEDYVGTKELNKALIDRFPIVLKIKYPELKKEMAIITAHTKLKDETKQTTEDNGIHSKSILYRMVEMANVLRDKSGNSELGFSCSTRQLIYWGSLIADYGVKKAAEITIVNKADDEDGKVIRDELNKYFRNAE